MARSYIASGEHGHCVLVSMYNLVTAQYTVFIQVVGCMLPLGLNQTACVQMSRIEHSCVLHGHLTLSHAPSLCGVAEVLNLWLVIANTCGGKVWGIQLSATLPHLRGQLCH